MPKVKRLAAPTDDQADDQIVLLPLADLQAAPYNPRFISDDQMRLLRKGVLEFGIVQPVVVNIRTGNIVGGHQRVEACRQLVAEGHEQFAQVPVIHVDLEEDREKALNLAMNKISGEFDAPKLKDLLAELSGTDGLDMELTGFPDADLEMMLGDPPSLAELEDAYQESKDDAFWPTVKVKCPKDVFDRFWALMGEQEGEDEAVKLRNLLALVGEQEGP